MTEDPRKMFTIEGETITTNKGDVRKPNKKKLRASLFNFVKGYGNIVSDVGEEPDMEEVVKRWYHYMKDKHGGSWIIFVDNNLDDGRNTLIELTEEMYQKHEPFREIVDDNWVYNEDVGPTDGGGQDQDGEPTAKGINYEEMDRSKLRGYMMKFVEVKSSIKHTSEEIDFEVFAEKFDTWMVSRLMKEKGYKSGNLKKLNEMIGGDLDVVEAVALEFYEAESFDKFRNRLDETWEMVHGESATEGISDYASVHGVDDGQGEEEEVVEETQSPTGISRWSEEHGTVNSYDIFDKDIEVNRIIQGDSKQVMQEDLPRNCVDMIITSPPYWAVRDYEGDIDALWDDGEWTGQLGHEPTPDLFVEHLMEVVRACKRVLKPTGTFWLNIQDTYGGKPGGHYDNEDYTGGSLGSEGDRPSLDIGDSVPQKSQAGVPERFVISMLNDGWLRRHTVHWAKQVLFEDDTVQGATKPSAVKDRFVDKAHEYLYFFVQQQDYYFDLDEVRRPHKTSPDDGQHYTESAKMVQEHGKKGGSDLAREFDDGSFYHEKGGNLPVIWQVNPARSQDEHYAPFPDKLIERPIKAGCPEGGIVLDPFFGTGTVGRVAEELNRNWVGIELSDKYVEIAKKNVSGTLQQRIA